MGLQSKEGWRTGRDDGGLEIKGHAPCDSDARVVWNAPAGSRSILTRLAWELQQRRGFAWGLKRRKDFEEGRMMAG